MTEEERVKQINEKSAAFLVDWLAELDEGTKTPGGSEGEAHSC